MSEDLVNMEDSGINLALGLDDPFFDISTINLDDLVGLSPTDTEPKNFYELRSKPVPLSESPSFKTESVKSRTSLKQQLMKYQMQMELDRKQKEEAEAAAAKTREEKLQNNMVKVPKNIQGVSLPQHVLHVTTGLKNPTKYHIMEKQKNQVLQFLSSSQGEESAMGVKIQVHSAPPVYPKAQGTRRISSSFNAPPPAPSPGIASVTSNGTSDAEDVIDTILSFEESSEVELQHRSLYGSQASLESSYTSLSRKQEVYSPYEDPARERSKKDTHNLIERRRRYNINDRIKELGDLLPQKHEPYYDVIRDSRANKGAILKSSVDYIKALKLDNNKIKQMEQDNRQLVAEKRELLLRIQLLENAAKAKGVQLQQTTWKPAAPATIIEQYIRPINKTRRQMPDLVTEAACAYDDSMDEVVLPDPVLGSAAALPSFQRIKMETD